MASMTRDVEVLRVLLPTPDQVLVRFADGSLVLFVDTRLPDVEIRLDEVEQLLSGPAYALNE